MTLLTRIEFVGLDAEGYTVSGHKFSNSIEKVEKWLEEQGIDRHIVMLCGLLPKEELVLDFDKIAEVYNSFESDLAFIIVFHAMNEYVYNFKKDYDK